MDAASCFILASEFVPVHAPDLPQDSVTMLLLNARSHLQQFPETLFISTDLSVNSLIIEAEHQGITVCRVSDADLQVCTGEAREEFTKKFGGGQ